jgi:hypothetical protein
MRRKSDQDRHTRVVTLRLAEDDYLWLKAAAIVTGESMNRLVARAVDFARGQYWVAPDIEAEIEAVVTGWKEKKA